MTEESPANCPDANLPRRLAAAFYDFLLVLSVCMATTASYISIEQKLLATQSEVEMASGTGYQVLLLLVIFAFFYFFWRKKGQTLGMQAWRLKVVDSTNGAIISPRQVLIRFCVAVASWLCFGLGFVWILFQRDNRSWHDLASNSRVILLPKKKD